MLNLLETFCLTLNLRLIHSPRLLVKGAAGSCVKRRTALAQLFSRRNRFTVKKVPAGAGRTSAGARWAALRAMHADVAGVHPRQRGRAVITDERRQPPAAGACVRGQTELCRADYLAPKSGKNAAVTCGTGARKHLN